jgi:hypothetical protein
VPTRKALHPIRRVRDAFKDTPLELDVRKYSTAEGFAKYLGRSTSFVRNVECGVIERWDQLASLVQKKTGVSREWLLSNPNVDDPILDVDGNEWDAGFQLDPLAPHGNMPDWRQLIQISPASIPSFVAESIKFQLIWELALGVDNGLADIIGVMRRLNTYESPALIQIVDHQKCEVRDRVSEKIWARRKESRVLRSDLEKHFNVDLNSISTEMVEEILQDQGFGWISRLDNMPKSGLIPEMWKHYKIGKDAGSVDHTDNDCGIKNVDLINSIVSVTNLEAIGDLEPTIPPLLKRGNKSSRIKRTS